MTGSSATDAMATRMREERATAAAEVRLGLTRLVDEIGERNDRDGARLHALHRAAAYVRESFSRAGLAPVDHIVDARHKIVNVEASLLGSSPDGVVVGAHYDSARGAPGADDNASGVLALLVMARVLRGRALAKSVRLVAFANEEPPHTRKPSMGSAHYASHLAAVGLTTTAMLSLEMLGAGPYLIFVANPRSRALARRAEALFRTTSYGILSRRLTLPGFLPFVRSSDHWTFWKHRVPAIMVTDGGPFRYPHYHRASDVPAHVDPDRIARSALGLADVVAALASA